MNKPEMISTEKYAEALNNLVGMDIGYLGDSDEDVNTIVELIKIAKLLEFKVDELAAENERLRKKTADEILGDICMRGVVTIDGIDRKHCSVEVTFETLDQIAKQYGIEVKE